MEPFVDPNYRPLGIASDMNNPNFVGAANPDSALHIRFYSKPVKSEFKTAQEGHPIFEDLIYVEIHTPGNQLNIIDRPIQESDKFRFRMQWDHYERVHGKDGQVVGTPLSQWPLLTPAQAETIKALKFYTVESIAFASDQQLQSMGMGVTAGVSPLALRDRAKAYLLVAKDSAFAAKQMEELQKRDQLIEAQGKQLAEMQEQMKALVAKVAEPEKRKPGRPKKSPELAVIPSGQ